jgi:hypothetical protein
MTEHNWPKPGDRMRFMNRNGYDSEREAALAKAQKDESRG